MNKSLFILFVIINGMINTNNPSISIENNLVSNENIIINDDQYELQIKIEPLNNDYNLIIEMKPKKGAHFISPSEQKSFSGKFHMDLGSYKDVEFINCLAEIPMSKNEFGPKPKVFGAENVKWIHQNTTYSRILKLKTKEDFEVFGRIQFTIEPRCTFEEIPFAISYKNGKMSLFSPKC